jgi:hypothetical protein
VDETQGTGASAATGGSQFTRTKGVIRQQTNIGEKIEICDHWGKWELNMWFMIYDRILAEHKVKIWMHNGYI